MKLSSSYNTYPWVQPQEARTIAAGSMITFYLYCIAGLFLWEAMKLGGHTIVGTCMY